MCVPVSPFYIFTRFQSSPSCQLEPVKPTMYERVCVFAILTRFWAKLKSMRGKKKKKTNRSLQCCKGWVCRTEQPPTTSAPPSGAVYSHGHLQRREGERESVCARGKYESWMDVKKCVVGGVSSLCLLSKENRANSFKTSETAVISGGASN